MIRAGRAYLQLASSGPALPLSHTIVGVLYVARQGDAQDREDGEGFQTTAGRRRSCAADRTVVSFGSAIPAVTAFEGMV